MAKSVGNVVDPFDMLEKFPLEMIKLYVLTRGPLLKDANFEEEDMIDQYNHFIDKAVNCYTRIFNKKMLKGCDFGFGYPELRTEFGETVDALEAQIQLIRENLVEMNPDQL